MKTQIPPMKMKTHPKNEDPLQKQRPTRKTGRPTTKMKTHHKN